MEAIVKRLMENHRLDESNTNYEFREKFDKALEGSSVQDKIDNVKSLINEYTEGLAPKVIIQSSDIRQLGKDALEDKIYDAAYNCTNGTWLKVNDRIYAYCYDYGWIDTGYMYNVAKGSMTARNIFGSTSCGDCYDHLKYKLDHSELQSVVLLK